MGEMGICNGCVQILLDRDKMAEIWHFEMKFPERKCFNFDQDYIMSYDLLGEFSWQKVSIASDNGFVFNRRLAINCSKAALAGWRMRHSALMWADPPPWNLARKDFRKRKHVSCEN